MMNTREGIIPSVLSSVVTTTGVLFRKKHRISNPGLGGIGFGLAHVVLGEIDLVQLER
ncbi:hypothetical protein GCM10011409_16030 [Lentibacillus populi]|uniref:Asparagine synthase n=2 Tax=Lentibacillus populi TaxID=1827502 RepID=A0A9W5X4Z4_9BACI|nr:asparagine synthase [Lentibacillus populi]GGB39273.1 hypothetical protein GCM10011409_16030 [Lentibacillus populi]